MKDTYPRHVEVKFSSPEPYPEIKISKENKYYGQLLMYDYSGITSEFTAINQYIYHHFVTKFLDEDISYMLEHVAIVEMRHLDILAELIYLLGCNPVFKVNNVSKSNNYWNSSYVYYGTNICDQLRANLNSEYKAIENYEKRITQISDPYIQAIIKRIILDEQVHITLFKEALKKYS